MKNKITLYSVLVMTALMSSACTQTSAKLIDAPNGKKYYVDTASCSTYKLYKGSMYCYTQENKCHTTVYKPVTSGCQTKVCGNSYTLSK